MPGGGTQESTPSLIRLQVPFSLQDLRRIKGDLGKFSDDLDKYIEAFQNITSVFELTWQGIMLLLNQTLNETEKLGVLAAAEGYGG